MNDPEPRVDRTAFSVISLQEDHDDAEYWLAKSPQERLEALELMRRLQYGDRASEGLQRILTVAELK
jgi:hypothetical protein